MFSIVVSIIETVSISAIMPFIDVVTNFENIYSNEYYKFLFDEIGFEKEIDFAIFLGFIILVFYLFRGVINLVFNYCMAQFSQELYGYNANRMFNSYLAMPYQVFVHKNSSKLSKNLITEAGFVSGVIAAALKIIAESFVVIFLYLLLLLASWEVTITFTIILGIKILYLAETTSKKMKSAGGDREEAQAIIYETLNRLFGNFKQVKLRAGSIGDNERRSFFSTVHRYTNSNTTRIYLGGFPKIFMETGGFSLLTITIILYMYSSQADVSEIIPTMSLFVLALYRILPSANRIISSFNTIIYYKSSVEEVVNSLEISVESLGEEKIDFKSLVELENVSFEHSSNPVLCGLNLTINAGDRIAFVGESGSGKSSLVDLVAGLYEPSSGLISIDGVRLTAANVGSWRSQIGYISQEVYLFDGTIEENVLFGRPLNENRLIDVLKKAEIYEFLEKKQGIHTLVGEGGAQLSGGQKQRVAIARALYDDPPVLLLDEATSALDEETEGRIMNAIYRVAEDKTLLVVAHRLSTITRCNRIYEVKGKQIFDISDRVALEQNRRSDNIST